MLLVSSNHRGWSFWCLFASFSDRCSLGFFLAHMFACAMLSTGFCAPFSLLPFTMFLAKILDLGFLDFAFAFGCLYWEWKGTLSASAVVASLFVPP